MVPHLRRAQSAAGLLPLDSCVTEAVLADQATLPRLCKVPQLDPQSRTHGPIQTHQPEEPLSHQYIPWPYKRAHEVAGICVLDRFSLKHK
eukprot:6476533-Amphidinium_carterae.1